MYKLEKIIGEVVIKYVGNQDPNLYRFIIHTTGYDNTIGNELFGPFDFLPPPHTINDPNYKEFAEKIKTSITTSISYNKIHDIMDFYGNCLIANISNFDYWLTEYNRRINKFGITIIKNNHGKL